MAAKSCAQCGAPLPIQVGRGRRRTKCATCSPPRISVASRRHCWKPVKMFSAKSLSWNRRIKRRRISKLTPVWRW